MPCSLSIGQSSLDNCPFQEDKPACNQCAVHCDRVELIPSAATCQDLGPLVALDRVSVRALPVGVCLGNPRACRIELASGLVAAASVPG